MKTLNSGCRLRVSASFIRTKEGVQPLPWEQAEQDLLTLLTFVHDRVDKALGPDFESTTRALTIRAWERDFEGVGHLSLKPAELARQAGLRYPCPGFLAGSRVEKLIQEQVASKVLSWDGLDSHRPKAGWSLNLGAVDPQMAKVHVRSKQVLLFVKSHTRELVLVFNKPRSWSRREVKKVTLPVVYLKEGRVHFSFALVEEAPKPPLSADYVLGVDRGKVELGTWGLKDLNTNECVAGGFLSEEVRNMQGKIDRILFEVKGIHGQIERAVDATDTPRYLTLMHQLGGKRAKLSRLRECLAKQAAQEIAALSAAFGNTLVVLEELGWAGNWNSRVPFGRFKKWMEHFLERSGSHLQTVNAAYTSQECCECGSTEHGFRRRDHVCHSCGVVLDRDVNAALVIAGRGASRARKSAQTRDKHLNTPKRRALTRSMTVRPTCVTASEEALDRALVGKEFVKKRTHGAVRGTSCMVLHLRV